MSGQIAGASFYVELEAPDVIKQGKRSSRWLHVLGDAEVKEGVGRCTAAHVL